MSARPRTGTGSPKLVSAIARRQLLAAGRSARVRSWAGKSNVARSVVDRFVGGPDEVDALRVARQLTSEGMLVSFGLLRSRADSVEEAQLNSGAYLSLLAALGRTGLAQSSEVSLSLSAIGLSIPGSRFDTVLESAREICRAAAENGTSITVEMLDHTATDRILRIIDQLRPEFPSVGTVLYAQLARTEADCRALVQVGARVRLCKAAYDEPAAVTVADGEISDSYLRCAEILLGAPIEPVFATHDDALISEVRAQARLVSGPARALEFQMMLGVRPDAQRALVAAGQRMRIYVPYGPEWYDYVIRRLAEHPANAMLLLRSAVPRG
jgi:proline dehydrogenase